MSITPEEKALVLLGLFGRTLLQNSIFDSQKSLITRGMIHDYAFSDLMEGLDLCVEWGWIERRSDDLLRITEAGLLISPR